MYIVAIAWIYVAILMAVAEATHSTGTLLGGIMTFVLYGVLPLGLVLYVRAPPRAGAPSRQRKPLNFKRPRQTQSSSQMLAAKRPVTRSRR